MNQRIIISFDQQWSAFKDIHNDQSGTGMNYLWKEDKNHWHCMKSNSGFHHKYGEDTYVMTDAELTLFILKHS